MKQNIYPKSYEGDDAYAFISYAHKDSKNVWPIIDHMNKDGYRCWYDDGIRPGTEWDDNVAEHIQKCEYFIAFISEAYIESDNCRDELNYARDLNKARVLIYIEEVELQGGLAMRLRRLQSIRKYKFNSEEEFYEKLYQADNIMVCRIQQKLIPAAILKIYEQLFLEWRWGLEMKQPYLDVEQLIMNFAKGLYSEGICEINTDIKSKLLYLRMKCNDFVDAMSGPYISWLVRELSLGELKKRYETYLRYVSKYQIRVATMTLSIERIEEYENYFRDIGLEEEQIKHIMADFVDMGDYIKRIDKVKKITEKLDCFGVSVNKRNQLMVTAAPYLYNDFLRKIEMVVNELINENGKEKAFELLLEDPELLRRY